MRQAPGLQNRLNLREEYRRLARSMFATLLKWLPIVIGLSLAGPAQAMDSNLYLIALAGQSNMTGAGDVRLLPVGFPMNGPRIWNFTNADIWERA